MQKSGLYLYIIYWIQNVEDPDRRESTLLVHSSHLCQI